MVTLFYRLVSFLVANNFELSMCAALKLNIHYDLLKFTLESTSKTISTSNYNVLLLFFKKSDMVILCEFGSFRFLSSVQMLAAHIGQLKNVFS